VNDSVLLGCFVTVKMNIQRPARSGQKRVKEPSSYATSNGKANTTQQSLHQSFSNLSIHNSSSKALSFWSGNKETSPPRERSDSERSRESETSALDRFLASYYETGMVRLSATVSENSGKLEFIISLTVNDFGSKQWCVIRSVNEIMEFCDSVHKAGVGNKFPLPPPAAEMLRSVNRVLPMVPSADPDGVGVFDSDDRRSSGKYRHQKKKTNRSRSNSIGSVIRRMSSRLSFSGRPSQAQTIKTCETVEEWINAALAVWQRHWHSKSDEQGISLLFERLICDVDGGKTGAPSDLLTAVDFVVLVVATSPDQNPALVYNRKRQTITTKAAIRLARDYPDAITIDALKLRVLAYAWESFESSHAMSTQASMRVLRPLNEEMPFMVEQVRTVEGSAVEPAVRVYTWTAAPPRLTPLRLNLVDNFSVPPTPRSLDHFQEVWKSFAEVVLFRAEQKLKALRT